MRRADQMNEGVFPSQYIRYRRCIECVSDERLRTCWDSVYRARPCKRANMMPARDQRRDQARADVAGAAGDEDIEFLQRFWPRNA